MNVLIAFSLTLIAGLSTLIGGLVVFVPKANNKKFLSFMLGLSAGVMIYISMTEILGKSNIYLSQSMSAKQGSIISSLAFFVGIALVAIIDKIIPTEHNVHEIKQSNSGEVVMSTNNSKGQLQRMGLMTMLAVGIHNFPEGLATFVTALDDLTLAIPIVVAIAIHNIPEGVAVAMPIYQASGSRCKAFWYTLFSGLAEPIGAVIGWLLLMPIMSNIVYGIIFASVAGIMVFISLDELFPTARAYGHHHLAIYGLVSGMAIMAFSLILLA